MLSMFSFIVIGLDWNASLLETMIDERVTPDNIVSHMLRSVEVEALCQNVVCKGDAGIEKDEDGS